MLEEALAYARRGWSIVPVAPRGKDTLVSWKDFQECRPSEAEIRGWWQRWPDANIGVVTGPISGLAVADVDPKRGGNASAQWAISQTGLIADTGGGGHHLFYAYPEGEDVRNKVSKTTGIDVRAKGGIIVLPPSVHESGRRYAWRTEGPLGVWRGVPPETVADREEKSNGHWLSDVMKGVGEGARDDSGAKLAGYFEGKGIPQDVALEMMFNWNTKNKPPLDREDVKRITESVYAGARSRKGQKVSSAPFTVTPFSDFMKKWSSNDTKWIVKDWLPDQTIMLTVAPPGSFKSWMLMDMLVSIATGKPFLGKFPVERSGPVMLIQQEDPGSDIAQRLSAIIFSRLGMEYKTDDPEAFEVPGAPNLPIHVHEERQLHFDDQNVMASFAVLIEQIKPVLVVIDPLYSAASTDDYMAKAASSMMLLKTLRDRHGTSFAIAHHTNKGKKEGSTSIDREDAWGSTFINAFLETGWQIRPNPDSATEITIHRHFKVRGALPDLTLNFDILTEGEYRYDVHVKDKSDEPEVSPGALVMEALEQGYAKAKDISAFTKLAPTEVRKILKKFEEDSIIMNRAGVYEMVG